MIALSYAVASRVGVSPQQAHRWLSDNEITDTDHFKSMLWAYQPIGVRRLIEEHEDTKRRKEALE